VTGRTRYRTRSGTRPPGYTEPGLAVLILSIATINVWNRLNAAVRQPAGSSW
jgi:alkylhydroperoxidase family enzyme